MPVSTGTAIIISSVIGAATASMNKPRSTSMPPLPSMEPVKQTEKLADKSVSDRIKATKSAMGTVATPKTLLAGTTGVEDEALNLGGKLI